MNKFTAFVLILIIAPLIGGLYGIVHDQITYSISPEYYTKFKFYQFGLMINGDEAIFPNPRLQVCIVGFMATWWMGIPIGLILGLAGLRHMDGDTMFRITFNAILITVLIAFITGVVGLLFGYFYLSKTGVSWWLPENLIDKTSFIMVGSAHNFSYLGGVIGLVVCCIYSVRQKKRLFKQY